MRSGGKILVDGLVRHGVTHVFGVPGESYLPVLDALLDSGVEFITGRQEGGAAMMADAHARLTGRPGICIVTRGPGATNASAGLHIAQQDSVPMILIVGQVARGTVDREAFQEIDYRRMLGQVAKWVAQIDDPSRIPEYLNRAFHTAVSGRPGPVVLAVPEDVLSEQADAVDVGPWRPISGYPAPGDVARLQRMVNEAKRPFVLLGGGGWDADSVGRMQTFAEAHALPVGVSFRCQDYIDNTSPVYVGHVGIGIDAGLAQRIQDADLLLVVGARLGEKTTGGYRLITIPRPEQTLIHVHPDVGELNRVYEADLAIAATMAGFTEAVAELPSVNDPVWKEDTAAMRAAFERFVHPVQVAGALQMPQVVAMLQQALPDDSIICNGAGNYAGWPNRFHVFRRYHTQLAPTSGSMGYGVPAAIGAKITLPDRVVVAWAGDGCFMMHGQELATAVQYGAAILVLLVDNGMFGTIRMHQERRYPTRVIGTSLQNPDFVKLAQAYGLHAQRVETTAEFKPALASALDAMSHGQGALLHLIEDPQAINATTTLTAIRETALAGGA